MTPKRTLVVLICILLITIIVVGDYSLRGPHEKLLARAEQKDSQGFLYWVTVRQNGMRFRTDLFEQGARSKLLISSYEFYEGSLPITNVAIAWPRLDKFSVSFQPSITVSCSWSTRSVNWSR
jgi:hypothetical protein